MGLFFGIRSMIYFKLISLDDNVLDLTYDDHEKID